MLKYQFGKASFVTIEDHAKWKYSVSADGCVGQTRLAKVLMSDSLVIKEESDWIEYYYRWVVCRVWGDGVWGEGGGGVS